MGTVKIASIYRSKIHSPRDKATNRVYYVPKQNSDSGISVDKEFLGNKELMNRASKFMNSPTNIRRIWLTCKHVAVEYYAGPLINGNQSDLIRVVSLGDEIVNLAKKFLQYRQLNPAQRTMSIDGKKPEEIKFDGRLSQAVTYPWTLNNIQEIYFDWTVLLSLESEQIIKSSGLQYEAMIKSYMDATGNGDIKNRSDIATALYKGLGNVNVNSSMKRLTRIAFVSNLDIIVGHKSFTESVQKFTTTEIQKESIPWIETEVVKILLNKINADIWVDVIDGTTNKNSKLEHFNIKKSQYEFDDKYLETKIKACIAALADKVVKRTSEAAMIESALNESVEAGSIEEMLLNVEKQYGTAFAQTVIRLTVKELQDRGNEKAISAVLGCMSPAKKSYYLKMISGK